MDRVAGELSAVTQRWGVAISFVKFQRVDAGPLTEVLAKRKNAGSVLTSLLIVGLYTLVYFMHEYTAIISSVEVDHVLHSHA